MEQTDYFFAESLQSRRVIYMKSETRLAHVISFDQAAVLKLIPGRVFARAQVVCSSKSKTRLPLPLFAAW
ncbi:hypothetical protein Plhal304r1_c007g0028391 [Plasmopara halstedii]